MFDSLKHTVNPENNLNMYGAISQTRYDIITIGSATVDVFVHTDPAQSEILNIHKGHKDLAYPLGAKILVKEMQTFVGGGGTNTAVAFSKLGLKTAYIGKIGRDDNGKTILNCLNTEKIEFIGAYGDISGYSVILDAVNEDRTILAYKGCNDDLKIREINLKLLDTKWLYMSSMMKESFKTQQKILDYAVKKQIKVAYNPSLYMVNNNTKKLKNMLKNIHVIIFNKEEAQALVKNTIENIYNLLLEVAKFGPKIVVITDGKNGSHCYVNHEDSVYSVHPGKVKVVETTGAGDAFASGFVAGLIHGKDISISLKLGMLNAESVIAYIGSKNILLGHKAFAMAENDKRVIFKKKL